MRRNERIKRDIWEKQWTGSGDWTDMGEKVSGRRWYYNMREKHSKKRKFGGLKKLSLGKAHETHRRTCPFNSWMCGSRTQERERILEPWGYNWKINGYNLVGVIWQFLSKFWFSNCIFRNLFNNNIHNSAQKSNKNIAWPILCNKKKLEGV